MTVLFSDSFQSGDFSAWTTSYGSPCVAEVRFDADQDQHFYRAHFSNPTNSGGATAFLLKFFGASSTQLVCSRHTVRLVSVQCGPGGLERFVLFRGQVNGTSPTFIMGFQFDGTSWTMVAVNADGTLFTTAGAFPLQNNHTYTVQAQVSLSAGGNPTYSIWIGSRLWATATASLGGCYWGVGNGATRFCPTWVVAGCFEKTVPASGEMVVHGVTVYDTAQPPPPPPTPLPQNRFRTGVRKVLNWRLGTR